MLAVARNASHEMHAMLRLRPSVQLVVPLPRHKRSSRTERRRGETLPEQSDQDGESGHDRFESAQRVQLGALDHVVAAIVGDGDGAAGHSV